MKESQLSLQNRFGVLQLEIKSTNNTWEQPKNVVIASCEETENLRNFDLSNIYKRKQWISEKTTHGRWHDKERI